MIINLYKSLNVDFYLIFLVVYFIFLFFLVLEGYMIIKANYQRLYNIMRNLSKLENRFMEKIIIQLLLPIISK